MDNLFFKSTPVYKEYLILDLISKNKSITQRQMSTHVGIAVSMVNNYLDKLESEGLVKRKYFSTKVVEYFITDIGKDKKRLLNISYLNHTQKLYEKAKEDVEEFLKEISEKGFKEILLYGAGEVAEILLSTIQSKNDGPVNVVAVIDDDINKIGKTIHNIIIISKKDLKNYKHDGILISSYTHHRKIVSKLEELNYSKDKIIYFFT